jgi:hypothetical protein
VTDVTASAAAEEDALDAVDEQLIRQLTDRARAEGLRLTGEGGLLTRLTMTVIESALEGELDDHLGYAKHDPAGRNGENSRNGRRGKTVLTEVGPVEIAVVGDRPRPQAGLHRAIGAGRDGGVLDLHRDMGAALPGDHQALGERVAGVCAVPAVRHRDSHRGVHDG